MIATDPVSLALHRETLMGLCSEIALQFSRRAHNGTIAEGGWHGVGIGDPDSGALIAQNHDLPPLYLLAQQLAMEAVLDQIRHNHAPVPQPGDVYMVNDPFCGLPSPRDVCLLQPIYYRGDLCAWLAVTGRWADMGGPAPAGLPDPGSDSLAEGLRLPPLRLYHRGESDAALRQLIAANSRNPAVVIGDLDAQAAALEYGARRLLAWLGEDNSATAFASLGEALRQVTVQELQAALAPLPDGQYDTQIDLFGAEMPAGESGALRLWLTKYDRTLVADFSKSDDPGPGAFNCPHGLTQAGVHMALNAFFPPACMDGGRLEVMQVPRPIGTFLDAQPPLAVGGASWEVVRRVAEATTLALAQMLPTEQTTTGLDGGPGRVLFISDRKAATGGVPVRLPLVGGAGGGCLADDRLTPAGGHLEDRLGRLTPEPSLEELEALTPVRVEYCRRRSNSGGLGDKPGDDGIELALTVQSEMVVAGWTLSHGFEGPHGVQGGHAGIAAEARLRPPLPEDSLEPAEPPEERILSPLVAALPMIEGTRLTLATAGGGGHGLPKRSTATFSVDRPPFKEDDPAKP